MSGLPWALPPDRCFNAGQGPRVVARELYATVKELPVVSPHGYVPLALLADPDARLGTPAVIAMCICDEAEYAYQLIASGDALLNWPVWMQIFAIGSDERWSRQPSRRQLAEAQRCWRCVDWARSPALTRCPPTLPCTNRTQRDTPSIMRRSPGNVGFTTG
jgi:hypothetical protein